MTAREKDLSASWLRSSSLMNFDSSSSVDLRDSFSREATGGMMMLVDGWSMVETAEAGVWKAAEVDGSLGNGGVNIKESRLSLSSEVEANKSELSCGMFDTRWATLVSERRGISAISS